MPRSLVWQDASGLMRGSSDTWVGIQVRAFMTMILRILIGEEMLVMLVEAYEKATHPIEAPDPISFLEYVMDARGLTRKDLEPYIGPRGRVADIMNRTRPLSMNMIRHLCGGLGLPADVLIQPYPLREAEAA